MLLRPHIITFLNKLDPAINKRPLRYGGQQVISHQKEISRRLPDLPQNKQISLGIFTQHYSLNRFTDEELRAIASLRLEIIDNNVNETLPKYIKPESNFYDSGSYRVGTQLAKVGLSNLQINYSIARSAKTVDAVIRELGL
jgi:hypothetical protein